MMLEVRDSQKEKALRNEPTVVNQSQVSQQQHVDEDVKMEEHEHRTAQQTTRQQDQGGGPAAKQE